MADALEGLPKNWKIQNSEVCPCDLDKRMWIQASSQLLSECQVPGAELTSSKLYHIGILTTALHVCTHAWIKCNYSHCTDEENEVQRVQQLALGLQLVRCGARN